MSSLSIPDTARDIRAATASNGSGAGMDLEVLAFGKTRACTGKAREGELCDKNDPDRLWQGDPFLSDGQTAQSVVLWGLHSSASALEG